MTVATVLEANWKLGKQITIWNIIKELTEKSGNQKQSTQIEPNGMNYCSEEY